MELLSTKMILKLERPTRIFVLHALIEIKGLAFLSPDPAIIILLKLLSAVQVQEMQLVTEMYLNVKSVLLDQFRQINQKSNYELMVLHAHPV